MDPIIGGSLISGAASLVGGLFGRSSARRANRQNLALAREQMQMQRDFATQGVQWRVADAKAAGLHPLAALGMSPLQYSPVQFQADGSSSMGEAVSEMGQNIGRAVAAQSTPVQKQMQALALSAAKQQLEEGDARIEVLRSEAFRNLQESLHSGGFPAVSLPDISPVFPGSVGEVPVPDMWETVRRDVVSPSSSDGSVAAGPDSPFWFRFSPSPGVTVELPGGLSGDPADVLESLGESPSLLAMVVAHNAKKHPESARWLKDLFTPGWDSQKEPWWRVPGAWLGRKLGDLRERAGNRTRAERLFQAGRSE